MGIMDTMEYVRYNLKNDTHKRVSKWATWGDSQDDVIKRILDVAEKRVADDRAKPADVEKPVKPIELRSSAEGVPPGAPNNGRWFTDGGARVYMTPDGRVWKRIKLE